MKHTEAKFEKTEDGYKLVHNILGTFEVWKRFTKEEDDYVSWVFKLIEQEKSGISGSVKEEITALIDRIALEVGEDGNGFFLNDCKRMIRQYIQEFETKLEASQNS